MFERYLTDALTTHFGHVVENLDSDKVRLSAWNGELVLKDLSLRTNALESFVPDCPVEIARGSVGNLELRIPWNLFRSQLRWRNTSGPRSISETGCSIVLTDVNILMTPRRQSSQSSSEEEKRPLSLEEQRLQRERQVQSLLDANLLQRVTESTVSSGRWTWVQDLLSNLLSNLSVTVRTIHIRYEDPGTSMGFVWSSYQPGGGLRYRPAFAVGVTLMEFSIQTDTDKDDDPDGGYPTEDAATNSPFHIRRKVAAAKQLAIYWDNNCELVSTADTEGLGSDVMNEALLAGHHSYLLDPVSPIVKIGLVPKAKDSTTVDSAMTSFDSDESSTDSTSAPANTAITPPSSVRLELPPCKFTISRNTLEDIAYIRRSLSVWRHATKGILSEATLRRLAKLRPLKPPCEDPRGWWHYAFEASLALERVNKEGRDPENLASYRKRRRGWMGLVQALKRRKHYMEMYEKFLSLSDRTELEACHQYLLSMEDELLPEEIAQFRFALYRTMIREDRVSATVQSPSPRASNTNSDNLTLELSVDQRLMMVEEMMQVLERERANARSRDRASIIWSSMELPEVQSNEIPVERATWKASVVCPEISLQVDEGRHEIEQRHGSRAIPVIRLSTAWIQKQTWFEDGSWDLDCSFASFAVRDLTVSTSRKYFPNLIGPKPGSRDDFVEMNGIRFERSISVTVRKKLNWNTMQGRMLDDFSDRGSTTASQIRILPMEVVYSTSPVEALSRVLATIKTPELVDDYHRVASAAHRWRERQKVKFLRALAHKYKKIIIDVDVGAPELLIPEDIGRRDTPMLAVNLGRLQMFNDSSKAKEFDDQWRVALSDIQVRSTTASRYYSKAKTDNTNLEITESQSNVTVSTGQLVEPFSLDFTISTKIASEEPQEESESLTRIQVSATLPRLAFNLTSSALRLASRLKIQTGRKDREMNAPSNNFEQRQGGEEYNPATRSAPGGPNRENGIGAPVEASKSSRRFHFQFSAPIVTLRLENDVDRRSDDAMASTALVDLAFQGIQGDITQDVSPDGASTLTFGASLHSMGAIDLYQHAGKDFALLMSSVPQHLVAPKLANENGWSWSDFHNNEFSQVELDRSQTKPESARTNDLVTIEYKSETLPKSDTLEAQSAAAPVDKLSIWCHELYVEWNPETLAAIQKAVRTPPSGGSTILTHYESDSEPEHTDDEFFDAMEDEFFDAGSDENSFQVLSEISSASVDERETSADVRLPPESESPWYSPNLSFRMQHGLVLSPAVPVSPQSLSRKINLNSPIAKPFHESEEDISSFGKPQKAFEVVFQLSKLRVSFNKESRHRKVMIAEMDGTSLSYLTLPAGGSKTSASIGNLAFIDPSKEHNTTLYGQILGLKSNAERSSSDDRPSSLLEMEVSINPKTRKFTDIDPCTQADQTQSVVIDREHGIMTGCNTFVKARFSPMRFVFLEQLWFEIIDYFFEGVLGTEVWGGTRPTPATQKDNMNESGPVEGIRRLVGQGSGDLYLHGSDAEGVSFTRFNISLDTPELLFPVTYRSPQFLRLQLESINVRNKYDGTAVPDTRDSYDGEIRMQWFNNCDISLRQLKIFSWCGRELGRKPVVANVGLRWPTGPLALMIKPKWNVRCTFDSLAIGLRRSDYALLQNIISFNVGEPSRHLDEWEALKSLSTEKVERYNEGLAVHFGYDKKDVAPTTYDLTVSIPSVSFSFAEHDGGSMVPLAIARCEDFVWSLKKGPDLVVCQKATCDVNLVAPDSNSELRKMLSLAKYDAEISSEYDDQADSNAGVPELTYTSTSLRSGDNVKTLEIVDACIYMTVPAWKRFASFFQGLPGPTLFSENDIGVSIQVGDRWYRMGGGELVAERRVNKKESSRPLHWIRAISNAEVATKPEQTSAKSSSHPSPSFQFKLSLTRPRIILSSSPVNRSVQRLILRMQHLEFLHTNNGQTHELSRGFFLHDVEVYTSSHKASKRDTKHGQNSLIHPWSVTGVIEKCNGSSTGACATHSISVSGDVLEARAAYSDMAIAIDVCLSVAHSARTGEISSSKGHIRRPSSAASLAESVESSSVAVSSSDVDAGDAFCQIPMKQLYCVELDGFELKVADDSGRHFAGDQDLVVLSLGKLLCSREDLSSGHSSMELRLTSMDLYDCLQSKTSPFRLAASSRSGAMGLQRNTNNEFSDYQDSLGSNSSAPRRKMEWEQFKSKPMSKPGFSLSPVLLRRISQASTECFSRDSSDSTNPSSATELIEVKRHFTANGQQDYYIKLRSFAVQWNPSTVIAIQRFLGRLRKESRINKTLHEFNQSADELAPSASTDSSKNFSSGPAETVAADMSSRIKANFEIDRLTACLNKEHQRRRLVELTLSGSRMHLDSSDQGLSIAGRLEDFSAWDSDSYALRQSDEVPILPVNRNVVKVSETADNLSNSPFLEIQYTTFRQHDPERISQALLPNWVKRHVSGSGEIDDFLRVTVAAFQFAYLRERTEEILDYLSNGLPGKGMGATSRAAKGFITKRILTKSFLELQISSPQVLIPQHESISDGIRLELGDVKIRSWFEKVNDSDLGLDPQLNDPRQGWCRVLSLDLTGFRGGFSKGSGPLGTSRLSSMTEPIDLHVVLRKPTIQGREVTIRGALSFVEMALHYSDYLVLRAVVSDNVGRKIDTERWDNVEKAYWLEEELDSTGVEVNEIHQVQVFAEHSTENLVAYSSNARFIRYGKGRKHEPQVTPNDTLELSPSSSSSPTPHKARNSLDLKFELGGMSLTLRRDDSVEGVHETDPLAEAFHYDLMLLRVQLIGISLVASSAGDLSFHLSLFRIGLFDLGDKGRLMRKNYYASLPSGLVPSHRKSKRKAQRKPCPFYVLAEGYAADDEVDQNGKARGGPQFVVTIDRCPATSAGAVGSLAEFELPEESKVIIAKIVINHLTLNALIRPFQEIGGFLSCEWPSTHGKARSRAVATSEQPAVDGSLVRTKPKTKKPLSNGFQLKVVAHYPRIFFLADESDPNTRALVLRGLAVVNLSNTKNYHLDNERHVTAVEAQLVSMESYINPDVSDALRFRKRHQDMLGATHMAALPLPDEAVENDAETSNSLGIALIQPVTTGLEFCEIMRDLFPTKRSVFVNIEPVSTMLSFEDLQLIEAVLKRWSRKQSRRENAIGLANSALQGDAMNTYDVTFHSERLGLGLKTEGNRVLVSSVEDPDAHGGVIGVGDTLLSIDEIDFSTRSLSDIVRCLVKQARPTTIRFGHSLDGGVRNMEASQKLEEKRLDETRMSNGSIHDDETVEDDASPVGGYVESYSVKFRTGMIHGLVLEKSLCGRFPVVTNVLADFFKATASSAVDETNAEQIEATFEKEDIETPRPGSIIVGINDFSIDEIGSQEVWKVLLMFSNNGCDDTAVAVADDPSSLSLGAFYTLHFKEIDSAVWGSIDALEVSLSGINISFIDDLKGRDMPLFRGNFSEVQVHAERGLGVLSRIVDVEPPSILKLSGTPNSNTTRSATGFSRKDVLEVRSEAIHTFSGITQCSIDYFHPRIAYWEPLLENSQLYMLCEKQASSAYSGRPGQLALEISDRLLHEQHFRGDGLPNSMVASQIVSVNLTDASVDVLVRSMNQWKEWRKSVQDENQVDLDEESTHQSLQNTDDYTVASIATKSSPLGGRPADGTRGNPGFGAPSSFENGIERPGTAEQVAAQQAAQAALVFAQKRGAETSSKGESAKPFIFRNRTGVSIAFVQQDQVISVRSSRKDDPERMGRRISLVGEYSGLQGYRERDVTELADQEDAKFSMELLPEAGATLKDGDDLPSASNKIRNYEGRFSSLRVAIQAVAGVTVAPLEDLEVSKVGSVIRYLTVQKDTEVFTSQSETPQYSIPVVWKVEIEDNRRVLTLSTAVRVVSTGFNTPIEVGVRSGYLMKAEHDVANENAVSILAVGVSRPGSPFYLPLWLSLRLQLAIVYVRPMAEGGKSFQWAGSSVLRFGPSLENESIDSKSKTKNAIWTWEESFPELGYVRCDPVTGTSMPVWFSVFGPNTTKGASKPRRRHHPEPQKESLPATMDVDDGFSEVLSVTLDSGLTLRNMLPMSIDWEVAHTREQSLQPPPTTVDGSSFREQTDSTVSFPALFARNKAQPHKPGILCSGDCTEVFACDYESQSLVARFKEPFGQTWSAWISLSCDEVEYFRDTKELEGQDVAVGTIPTARQVNVQVTNDAFGVPLTLGVRMLPKMTLPTLDDPTRGRAYGLEVILHAELWIRNITDLPLNFGCPCHQFHEAGNASGDGDLAARFTAESALMEIANLLEVGDKGTGLSNKRAEEVAESGKLKSLPNQECETLIEEVFEYIEIESSTVKRRWWASESYDSYRERIVDAPEPKGRSTPWKWQDERWSIDCSGQADASFGGWESCRNLLAGAGSFTTQRSFSPGHPIRRRRFFRSRSGHFSAYRYINNPFSDGNEKPRQPGSLAGGLQAFHQPITDSFTKEKRRVMKNKKKKKRDQAKDGDNGEDDSPLKIAIKCGDGKWSTPAIIPSQGTSHGVMRVVATRWLNLARNIDAQRVGSGDSVGGSEDESSLSATENLPFPVTYRCASLDTRLFELCYTVSDAEGEWGEFSRTMTVLPRFLVRNDSKKFFIEVKQAGVPDSAALKLSPGEVQPFYWADFRLPGLVSVAPAVLDDSGQKVYQWSGGFDLCNLGMVPIRIRTNSHRMVEAPAIKSIRATIEVRPGTGGTGINVSFKEENPEGVGSLFRVENLSTFPVWIAQDGVLANPLAFTNSHSSRKTQPRKSSSKSDHSPAVAETFSASGGDLFRPLEKSAYALDVPYRQGKYAHRKEATMSELLRVRVALSPLSSRDGIETVKVIGLTKVGDSIRLNPSRLFGPLTSEVRSSLQRMRVLAVVTTDGPTRVLKFCLMENPSPDVFGNPFGDVAYMASSKISPDSPSSVSQLKGYFDEVRKAAFATVERAQSQPLPSEDDAKRLALLPTNNTSEKKEAPSKENLQDAGTAANQIYSFRAEFSGFLFSLVDSTPSEIAVASLKNFNVLSRWDSLRTSDASLIGSIGWLQVDNHVPSAPFKVVVRPDTRRVSVMNDMGNSPSDQSNNQDSPLLVVALAFAPKHKSGIMCLRSVTVAPRNLVIALDLAFLVRLQRFLLGIGSYFNSRVSGDLVGDRSGMAMLYTDQKRCIAFPKFDSREEEMERAAVFSSETQKVYFHGLTILPCNITLSVAPARALTSSQASLEGKEAAAIHQAVRKGDVLLGNSSALLGVRVGRRNATPLAVVRGVLKSIVVDALLRLDGASLNFSGVKLRNHVSTGPQLTTLLLSHYLSSLRQNVPALIGSLAAFGNPLGLIRGLGDGMSDFVNEPVKGLKKSVKELDPSFLVDGVARGTESLARHTVGGFADSASLLTETFSKNMAVLTLDRRYAQKRDRKTGLRLNADKDITLAGGVESGFIKLVQGFRDGVTGVVKAPIRGAEKRGIEGFAKGVGKGLLGLLVKPMIGISDAATDVMIGVKRTVEDTHAQQQNLALSSNQFRPRRPMYGRDKVLRPYKFEDAAAATLMLRTRCAGENYLSHLDLGDRVALLSVHRMVLIGANGQEMFVLKFKHVSSVEVRPIPLADGSDGWGIIILLNTPRRNGSDIEVISCKTKEEAMKLYAQIKRGTNLDVNQIS